MSLLYVVLDVNKYGRSPRGGLSASHYEYPDLVYRETVLSAYFDDVFFATNPRADSCLVGRYCEELDCVGWQGLGKPTTKIFRIDAWPVLSLSTRFSERSGWRNARGIHSFVLVTARGGIDGGGGGGLGGVKKMWMKMTRTS